MQRLLSAKNERDSRLALFSSWVVVFFQFALFLVIGVLLYAYYRTTGRPRAFAFQNAAIRSSSGATFRSVWRVS